MSNFPGAYLRVLEPLTTNGVNLKYDKDGKVRYREQHAPLEARTSFEARNAKLPQHLRLIIETVGEVPATPSRRAGRPQTVPRTNPQPSKPTNNKQTKVEL